MTESSKSPSPTSTAASASGIARIGVVVLFLLAFGMGIALRAPRLAERPMHTDEAILAHKFGGLLETRTWKYDPADYHGPALPYLTLPFAWATGAATSENVSETLLRSVPIAICMSIMLLSLAARRELGGGAIAASALFLAVSPIFVFYSRYYIMELLLVFFSLAAIISGWRYWRSRSPWWLIPAGISLAMMHAAKETCVIHYFAMGAAFIGCVAFGWIRPASGEKFTALVNGKPLKPGHLKPLLGAVLVTWLLFYSSFFTNWRGLIDSITTYASYLNRAEGSGHEKPWFYYLQLLFWTKDHYRWTEAGILVFGVAGAGFAFFRRPKEDGSLLLARFLAFYAAALIIVYSIISYKTPWTILGFHHALILLAGFGAASLWQTLRRTWIRAILVVLIAAMCGHLGYQAHRAIGRRLAADTRNPYVYVHTSTAFYRLLKRLDELAAIKHPDDTGADDDWLQVQVVHSEAAWPLPWYTRMHKTVGFPSSIPSDEILARTDVIITEPGYAEYFREHLANTHVQDRGIFSLRPSIFLTVFIHKDLLPPPEENTLTEPQQ
ncbi:MAG: TIGR03663 family protein [Verrucomicrobiales bacterium]